MTIIKSNTNSRINRFMIALALGALTLAASAHAWENRGNAGNRDRAGHVRADSIRGDRSRGDDVRIDRSRNDIDVNRNVNVDVRGRDDYHPLATAAAVTATVAVTAAVVGSIARSLPAGCGPVMVDGVAYQQCGNTWYQPQYAGTETQYVVVAAPR
ncbi:hypothetical protein BGLT_03031 [Caballeronia glathei]|jgi:hypothetical protein|nr:hypothetical protein B0G84_1355 [Paraburkholderia sp. BL8N3]CDY73661.1 hypothetical protein BGLT_03031 [Caballeronia glathei]